MIFAFSIAILLGLLLFLIHIVRRSPGTRDWAGTPRWPKLLLFVVGTIFLLLAILACWSFLIEPGRLVTPEATIHLTSGPTELGGLRLALISDIHAGAPFIDDRKLSLIVERTNSLQPDLIVLLGDYMSGDGWPYRRVEPEVIAAGLKGLHAPFGVFSVLSNHDWWYDGPRVRRALEQSGIKVLDDEVMKVKWRRSSFWVAGLADL